MRFVNKRTTTIVSGELIESRKRHSHILEPLGSIFANGLLPGNCQYGESAFLMKEIENSDCQQNCSLKYSVGAVKYLMARRRLAHRQRKAPASNVSNTEPSLVRDVFFSYQNKCPSSFSVGSQLANTQWSHQCRRWQTHRHCQSYIRDLTIRDSNRESKCGRHQFGKLNGIDACSRERMECRNVWANVCHSVDS